MSSRPAAAARPRTARDGSRGRLPAVTARGVALVVVALVAVGSVVATARAWVEQRSALADLRADVAQREQHVAALQAESDRWDDPAYAAAQARARLEYVVPGETRYAVLGAPASASPSAPAPTATPSPEPTSLVQQLREGLKVRVQAPVEVPPAPASPEEAVPSAAAEPAGGRRAEVRP